MEYGSGAHARAHKALGKLLLDLIVLVPGGLASLPEAYPLELRPHPAQRRRIGEQRTAEWFSLRRRIEERDEVLEDAMIHIVIDSTLWEQARAHAEQAVREATEALYCLREALVGIEESPPRDAREEDLSRVAVVVGYLVDETHHCAHAAGEVIGGLFGCQLEYKVGSWMTHCATDLMHTEMGFSPGFTARHACSICDVDLSSCDHLAGTTHAVTAATRPDGTCSACGEHACAHEDGDLVDVVASSVLRDATLHEVSLTDRPRDPRNRVTSVDVTDDELVAVLGRMPSPGQRVLMHGCMYPCDGFRAAPIVELC